MTIKDTPSALVEARKLLGENKKLRQQLKDLETSHTYLVRNISVCDQLVTALEDEAQELRDQVADLQKRLADIFEAEKDPTYVRPLHRVPGTLGGPDA